MSVLPDAIWANTETPLWGGGGGPNPTNLNVSTISVNPEGAIILDNSGVPGVQPIIAFNHADNLAENASRLQITNIQPVPGIVPQADDDTLSVTKSDGFFYDNVAGYGLIIMGDQAVSGAGAPAAGYLTEQANDVVLFTKAGQGFRTQNITCSTITTSTISYDTVEYTNIAASTISVNSDGLIVMENSGAADPTSAISFNHIDNTTAGATWLEVTNIQPVPGILPGADDITLSVTKNTGNNYDNLAGYGYIIMGDVATNSAGAAAAGYLTEQTNDVVLFTLPGQGFRTQNITCSTITASTINGTAGVVSSFTNLFAQNATISSLSVSSLEGGNLPIPVISTTVNNTQLLTVSSVVSGTAIGTAVGTALSKTVSGVLGQYLAAGATAFVGTALGAAGLATGVAGLYLSRTSGGVDTNSYQTINGTTQLQFSTLGSPQTSLFLTTISPDPNNIPSTLSTITTTIPAGAWCMRAVSDPINLANTSGQDGEAIQAFNQWSPVLGPTATFNFSTSVMKEYNSGNFIDMFDEENQGSIYKRMTISSGQLVIKSQYGVFIEQDLTVTNDLQVLSSMFCTGVTADFMKTSSITCENTNFKGSINFFENVSSVSIYPELRCSSIFTSSITADSIINLNTDIDANTISASTLTVRNTANISTLITSTLSVIGQGTISVLGATTFSAQALDVLTANISTLNTNSFTTSTLTVRNTANISSATISTASISTASIPALVNLSSINGIIFPAPGPDTTNIQNLAGNVFVSADVSSVTVSTNSVYFRSLSTITPYTFANPPTNFLTYDPATSLTQNATVASMFQSLFNANVFGAYLPTTWPGYGLTVPTTCVNIVIGNLRIMAGVVYKTPPSGGGSSNLTFSISGTSFSYAAGSGIGFGNTAIMAFTQPIEPVTVTNIAATQAPRNCYTNYNGGTGLIDVFIASPTINDAQPFTPEASWMSAYYWCLMGGTFGSV